MGLNNWYRWISGLIAFVLTNHFCSAKLEEVNRVVARVNNKVVTWGEIDLAMEKLNFTDEEKKARAKEFVDGKIDRLLSQVAFKKKGMVLPETYIEQEYSSKLMSNFNGDRRLFREVLQSHGQSPLEYKKQLEEDIIHMHMLSQRKRTNDEISPKSVEEYYKKNPKQFLTERRVKLKEIVFSEKKQGQNESLEEQAKKCYDKILKSGDFDKFAQEHGQSPFIEDAGNWGVFVSRNEIRNSRIKETAFSLKKGEVSKPFEVNLLEQKEDGSFSYSGKSAWYILKIFQEESAGRLPLSEVRSEIESILAKEAELSEQRIWLSRQKRDAFVDITLPE